MRVAVSGGALRLVAMQALAEAKRTPLRAFLLGEVAAEVGVAGGALVLTVARFDLGVEDARGQWRPACALPGEVAVPVLVVLEESTDDALTAAEGEAHAAAASVARLAVSAAPRLELGTALGYAATGVLRRRPDAQDGHILSLRWTVTAAACTLEVWRERRYVCGEEAGRRIVRFRLLGEERGWASTKPLCLTVNASHVLFFSYALMLDTRRCRCCQCRWWRRLLCGNLPAPSRSTMRARLALSL